MARPQAQSKYRNVSPLTELVLTARDQANTFFDYAAGMYADPPFMKRMVAPQTRDKNLMGMQPSDMLDFLNQHGDDAAEQAAQRIQDLQSRSRYQPNPDLLGAVGDDSSSFGQPEKNSVDQPLT